MALTPNEAYAAKQPFVDKETLEHIVEQFPTPFHLYDEAGIRRNMQEVRDAFAWNPGFKEYFAVKANPNPALISILNEYGCGCDCSSYTELMIARSLGITGHDIMFSSNDTPAADFELADKLGAIVNFDDISHIEFFERVAGPIPKTVSCRFNPGGLFQLSNGIMDNPGDSKYGMTTEQLFEAFRMLKAKGAENFGIHAFLASNTVTNDYYPKLARILFKLAVRLERETGAHVAFINLSGGVGIPYLPEQQANNIHAIGEGVHAAYDEILVPAGMGDVAICTEMGRFMMGPYGCLVTKAIHEKQIYKDYIGVDASAVDLIRPAMYGAYHQWTPALRRGPVAPRWLGRPHPPRRAPGRLLCHARRATERPRAAGQVARRKCPPSRPRRAPGSRRPMEQTHPDRGREGEEHGHPQSRGLNRRPRHAV